jgi:hypothetical protein
MQGSAMARYVIPVYGLLEPVMGADFNTTWRGNMGMVLLGLVQSAILLLMATWIFARRDLAVAVE